MISPSLTTKLFSWGTSIPTADLPGIGASILTSGAAKASDISSDKLTILLTLTPVAGCTSYLVIVGPCETSFTSASTPKLAKVSSNSSLLFSKVILFLSECVKRLSLGSLKPSKDLLLLALAVLSLISNSCKLSSSLAFVFFFLDFLLFFFLLLFLLFVVLLLFLI